MVNIDINNGVKKVKKTYLFKNKIDFQYKEVQWSAVICFDKNLGRASFDRRLLISYHTPIELKGETTQRLLAEVVINKTG